MTDDNGGDLLKMVQPWTVQEKGELLKTNVFRVAERSAQSPTSPDKGGTFYYLDTPDWVNVIALTKEGQMVLIEQYRHATKEVTLEIPGGMVDPGEAPQTAALRELREESGYYSPEIEMIGSVTPNPAIINNRCHTALVTNAVGGHPLQQDSNEEIAVRLLSLDQVWQLTREGVIHHALVLAAFFHFQVGGHAARM